MELDRHLVPLRERKKANTEARLRSAALRLFSERGFGSVSVDEICHEAEVSRSTFFRYFGSKEAVLFEQVDTAGAAFIRDLEARPPDEPPSQAFTEALLARAHEMIASQVPHEQRIINDLLRNDPALRGRHLQELERWTEATAESFAKRAGRKEPGLSDRLAAATCMAVSEEVARVWRSDPRSDPAKLIQQAFATARSVWGP